MPRPPWAGDGARAVVDAASSAWGSVIVGILVGPAGEGRSDGWGGRISAWK